MDCAEVREEFSALLDGELDAETRAAVEAHLAGCADCLRELDRLKQVDAAFHGLAPKQAPEDMEERVRAGLQANVVHLGPRRLARKRVWPLVASAAGLLIVLGVSVFHMRKSPERFEMASLEQGPEQGMLADDMDTDLSKARSAAGAAPRRKGMAAQEFASPGAPSAQEPAPVSLQAAVEGQSDEAKSRRRVANLPALAEENPRGVRAGGEISKDLEKDDGRADTRAEAQEELSALGYLGDDGTEVSEELAVGESADSLHNVEDSSAPSGGVASSKPSTQPPVLGVPFAAKESAAADVHMGYRVSIEDAPEREEGGGMGVSHVPTDSISRATGADRSQSTPPLRPVPVIGAAPPAPSPPPSPAPATAERGARALNPEPTPRTASRDKAKPASTVREVAGRTFEWREGTWYEEGYRPESDAEDLVTLVRGSSQFKELVKEHAKLAAFAAVGDRVVFRFQRKWWSVRPAGP